MKTSYSVIAVVAVLVAAWFMFGRGEKLPEATSPEVMAGTTTKLTDGTYKLDLSKSSIKVTGEYLKGGTEEGVVSFASGSLMTASGQPFAGTFEVDLTTLTTEGNLVLENYVKGKELLDVDNHPTSTFVIRTITAAPNVATSTGKYIVEGKLTIKGNTQALSFPITVSQNGNRIYGHSNFAINRAEWGLDANNELRNAVLLDLHIEATK